MSFAIGSLVRARGREWVVLPESTDDTLIARPLGGGDSEVAGIYLPLEKVEPATFRLPDPAQPGDYRSCRLLRDALRLGFRSSAGPFRSFARIAVEPRPYQLVPLLMALKLDPVRILIADDVGIGKTIEAALIVRELIDRGEVRRFTVLCPPQIAEQWAEKELAAKFHLDAELVLASTVGRLERACRMNQSIFERFPYTVVSTDFIKADRRRDDFLRAAPELVIVDEAHACAWAGEGKGSRHQRHALVKGLAADPNRHLILVTATPHSGNEGAFRSLLALLDPRFADLPDDLSGEVNEQHRRGVAAHLVQRRRKDILQSVLGEGTAFPKRTEPPVPPTYKLTPAYRKLFDEVLAYAEERVFDTTLEQRRQRIRWWSALALLRSVASSPAAAAMTLRTRAVDANTPAEADDAGRRAVLDLAEDDSAEGTDVAPPGDDEVEAEGTTATDAGRRLMRLALEADALRDDKDPKLQKIVPVVKKLLEDGFHPILFCRFIPTAEYVAEHLRKKLKGVEVAAVTGTLPPKEREDRVGQLGKANQRVLVCTDCLSEGINLQHSFNAVIHYDLSWNPTRHEQREGRVDRFGQPSAEVRCVTYFGEDNLIDDLVLKVLLRKTRAIRNSLGVSVPLPGEGERVVQEAFKVLLKNWRKAAGPGLFDDLESEVELTWRSASEREKKSQTLFAQRTINVEEVAAELQASRQALGSAVEVAAFVRTALTSSGGVVEGDGRVRINLVEAPRALRDCLGLPEKFLARFDPAVGDGEVYLGRTHPAVESLANHVLNAALDPFAAGPARRSGVIRTSKVTTRTTLLLLRHRFHIVTRTPDGERQLLAEDAHLVAFSGSPQSPVWLKAEDAERLPEAEPDGNVLPDQAQNFLQRVIDGMESLRPRLAEIARERGELLLEAHRRVRQASRAKGVSHRVEAQDLPDVLGVFVYLPKAPA
jgi:superfamily II DNA or RNA helicase